MNEVAQTMNAMRRFHEKLFPDEVAETFEEPLPEGWIVITERVNIPKHMWEFRKEKTMTNTEKKYVLFAKISNIRKEQESLKKQIKEREDRFDKLVLKAHMLDQRYRKEEVKVEGLAAEARKAKKIRLNSIGLQEAGLKRKHKALAQDIDRKIEQTNKCEKSRIKLVKKIKVLSLERASITEELKGM